MSDRIASLEDRQQEQGNAIARLETQMATHAKAIDANTKALNEFTKTLAEYNGARKLIHWLVAAGTAVGGYFVGKGHP